MRATALHHTEMAEELTMLWSAVSSAVGLVLVRSPNETFRVEVTDDLVAQFWRLAELYSWHEGPDVRICDLQLEPHSVKPDGPTILVRPLGNFRQYQLHNSRWAPSWRPCGLRLHAFGT
jgi:hypothetical protein